MSKYKDILKNGWHPEKEGTTLKGQVVSYLPPVACAVGPGIHHYYSYYTHHA